MNRYIEKLKTFLAQQSPNFGYDDANSILDMLYYYYTDTNAIDNAVIRCQFYDGVNRPTDGYNPSVSFADSSLYTREPFLKARRICFANSLLVIL